MLRNPRLQCSFGLAIQTTNGADVMKLAREYERKTVALVRYRHHLTFNHLLKSSDLLPPSLIFTPPVRTKVGYKIARKTGIKYLRLRITQCHHSIRHLSTKLKDLKEQLENKLTQEHMHALEDAVETTSKATTVEISATHTRKYNQLKGNNKASSSNLVNKDKWVNNISKRTLSPVEIAALMKGFNFAITPKEVLVSKILSSIDTGIYSLSQTAKDTVRVGVTNILRTCKNPL